MKNKNIKLVINYLHRFVEGPVFSRQKWVAFWRYAGEAISLIYEKTTGLDYSMPYYTKDECVHNSVYTKVPKKVLRRIFKDVSNIENKAFIDVGCGKCYAVTNAAKIGFKRYGGVEYTKHLYDVGISNLRRKGLSTKDIYNEDAQAFEHYAEFDVFFFNNPFDETIMRPVAKRIFDSHINQECSLYFLNPLKERAEAVEAAGFRLIKHIPDKSESYFDINVYSNMTKD